ncbi:MAG: metallophosphoesterase family protein [Bacteroidota bacterium]
MKHYFPLFLAVVFLAWHPASAQNIPHEHPHPNGIKRAYRAPSFAHGWEKAGQHPDHIVLNLTEDPSTSMSVTWRTSTAAIKGYAEIAPATGAPKFWRTAKTYKAKTEVADFTGVLEAGVVNAYHSVTFTNLEPGTVYAYRVGDGDIWSEWIQFRTAAAEAKPFSFLYVGDAQNYILELWSRLIREGYRQAPDASFIIHAGDLINTAHNEQQWHEWFTAGGFIHSMVPSLPTPGNHEYWPRNEAEMTNRERHLSAQWQPQFTLPLNGPANLDTLAETVYFVDYQDTRIISLNSNKFQEAQVPWLDSVLTHNPNKWTVVTFHHPLFSASARRDNNALRKAWKPLFDKHNVDLVLQGHDHSYARGRTGVPEQNVMAGLNRRDYTGSVYVVSVSGGKMYDLNPNGWDDFKDAERDRGAENTQLIQAITIDGDKLSYEGYTAIGELYDAFDLIKAEGKPNRFVERKQEAIPARRFDNTIPYQDELPLDLKQKLLDQFPGATFSRITYVDEPEFRGYYLRLSQEGKTMGLKIDDQGTILHED